MRFCPNCNSEDVEIQNLGGSTHHALRCRGCGKPAMVRIQVDLCGFRVREGFGFAGNEFQGVITATGVWDD